MFLPTPTGGNRLLPPHNARARAGRSQGARCPQLSVPLPFQGATIGQGVGALNTYARRPQIVDESVPCCGA